MQKPVILCVDDEQMILSNLDDQIGGHVGDNYDIELAESGEEGLEIVQEALEDNRHIALIICDQLMPNMKGEDFIIEAHKLTPQTLKIMLTGQASLESVSRTINEAQLFRYIAKPWNKQDLLSAAEEALGRYNEYLNLLEYSQLMAELNETSQAFSEEKDTNQLVSKFVESTLNTLGAEKGYLVLKGSLTRNGEQFIKFSKGGGLTQDKLSTEVQKVIDAALLPQEGRDSIASELQHKGKSIGTVYLENTITKQTFNKNQRDALNMLATHAAISLENAELYNRLKSQNAEILAGIRTAKQIQTSILPELEQLYQLQPDAFVLFNADALDNPQFYWWNVTPAHAVLGVFSTNSQGVSSTLISSLVINHLNQVVKQNRISDATLITKMLNPKLKNIFTADKADGPNLGLSYVLVSIDYTKKTLKASGSNQELGLVKADGSLSVVSLEGEMLGRSSETPNNPTFKEAYEDGVHVLLEVLNAPGYGPQPATRLKQQFADPPTAITLATLQQVLTAEENYPNTVVGY